MSVSQFSRMIRFGFLALLLVFASGAAAQDPRVDMEMSPAVQSAQDLLDGADRKVAQIQKQVADNADDDLRLIDLKLEVEELSRKMIEVGVSLRPRLTEVKSRIELLGDPPAQGQPEEPAETQAERARLSQERSLINALTGRAETISIQANNLGDEITETRRELSRERFSSAAKSTVNCSRKPPTLSGWKEGTSSASSRVGCTSSGPSSSSN